MNDVRVKTWLELEEVLYDFPKTSYGRHRSEFVYRGHADSSWRLGTTLTRLGGDYVRLEEPLLRSFAKYVEPGTLPSQSVWVKLSVAQHHGLPTRLLDWTLSPRVAVHFATSDERHYDKDAVIWCVHAGEARRLLPKKFQELLARKWAYVFSVDMLDELVPSLERFDDMGDRAPFLAFFEPPSIDGRIVNQAAVFSVVSSAVVQPSDILDNHPDMLRRVVIPAGLKWEIRDRLDQDNVNERMLFPGVDGLCQWLRRHYGPGPGERRVSPTA